MMTWRCQCSSLCPSVLPVCDSRPTRRCLPTLAREQMGATDTTLPPYARKRADGGDRHDAASLRSPETKWGHPCEHIWLGAVKSAWLRKLLRQRAGRLRLLLLGPPRHLVPEKRKPWRSRAARFGLDDGPIGGARARHGAGIEFVGLTTDPGYAGRLRLLLLD